MENHGIFENYLNGSMTETEKSDFEKQLSENPDLKKEFLLYNEVNNVIAGIPDKDDFMVALKNAETRYFDEIQQQPQKSLVKSNIIIYRIAASVAFIITVSVLGYYLLNSKIPPKKIYAEYYVPYRMDVVSRSSVDSLTISEQGFMAYQEGRYNEAVSIFLEVAAKTDVIENMIIGLAYMELNEFSNAEKFLQLASADETNAMHDDCLWYLALTYIKLEKSDMAIPILDSLIKNDSVYKSRAEKILKELN